MPKGRPRKDQTPEIAPENQPAQEWERDTAGIEETTTADNEPQEAASQEYSLRNEQQSPVPMNVRITSLEMDGATRAFASADYGDLTINRIRVKQDEYGTLSVSMPRFRQASGWKDTCTFNTVEARNRLTGAVLDAYDRQMAQIKEQAGPEMDESDLEQDIGQDMDQDETQDFAGQESGGPVMGMSQC